MRLGGKVRPDERRRSSTGDPSQLAQEDEEWEREPLPRLTGRSLGMLLLISMGGFIFGYDTGQISGFLEMKDFLRRFGQRDGAGQPYFSTVRSGLIVALLSIGTLIGALVGAPIADRLGRKYSIVVWSLIFCVGMIIQITSQYAWYQVMIGRLVAGLGVGGLSLLVPMYQAETSPPHIRGALISSYQLFITLGIFLAAVFNYAAERHQSGKAASWQITMGLGFVFASILGFGILLFAETPRFDYRKGRIDRAKNTMSRVYGVREDHPAIKSELAEIKAKLDEESVKGSPIREFINMWKAPKMAHRLLIGCGLQMFQQLTGANYFFYYGVTIFQGTGINNSYVTQMILNGINFGTTFYGLYIVEHYGRRKSLIAGSIWMFICFMIFASVGAFSLDRENPQNTEQQATVMICFACFFIFGFATTWGPMIWTICGELFPSRYRAKAMALTTATNWLWNFLIAFFTPFITKSINFKYGYVFAGCNLVAGLLVYFFVIEGKGRTLEEIDTMYLLGVKPWQSAKYQIPDLQEADPETRRKLEEARAQMAAATAPEAGEKDKETAPAGSGAANKGVHAREEV
ncbi:MFS monosaccharide transporter-like protein [Sporormia fimetaria CBS 119925]|uniref:MFS monosaccharide transporter-like protein n=1 Tax=Sporormia fimetaria CBS 119925 TaxID=1340428 RepID=A0A6A6VFL1_9PLEO|nr:MFS monosaccharide transporter-like protein [Sporormia fimetaria CBS 119925]